MNKFDKTVENKWFQLAMYILLLITVIVLKNFYIW